jgi:hypothetical protein
MAQQRQLAKSLRDAGWGALLILLTHQAACAGRRVSGVNPASTSQRCSGCGAIVLKGLSVRWPSCSVCGTFLHWDHTAAKNRERAGLALRGGLRRQSRRPENPLALAMGSVNRASQDGCYVQAVCASHLCTACNLWLGRYRAPAFSHCLKFVSDRGKFFSPGAQAITRVEKAHLTSYGLLGSSS